MLFIENGGIVHFEGGYECLIGVLVFVNVDI